MANACRSCKHFFGIELGVLLSNYKTGCTKYADFEYDPVSGAAQICPQDLKSLNPHGKCKGWEPIPAKPRRWQGKRQVMKRIAEASYAWKEKNLK